MPFYIHMPDDCFTLLAVVHPLLSHFCRDFSAKIVFHRCSSVLSVALDRTHAFSDLFSLVASFWWGYRLISKSSPYICKAKNAYIKFLPIKTPTDVGDNNQNAP
jgi:hypothetical protein